jgi:methylated-DNA-[protein]-cysteine S-methyltransferase
VNKRQRILSNISKDRTLSVFEKSVYRAVLTIPQGCVRTYTWVAKKAGYPQAARAVGSALNKNPYIGIVPCHRVVRSDGSVGGFAGGTAAKARMLKREGIDVRGMRLL